VASYAGSPTFSWKLLLFIQIYHTRTVPLVAALIDSGLLLPRSGLYHATMNDSDKSLWGPTLIVGGSGRLGYFIAKQLLQQSECGRIVSINRSKNVSHPCPGVEYFTADVCDTIGLRKVVHEVRPETIINVAAPAHTTTSTPRSAFNEVFVKGQDTLIEVAKDIGTLYMICTTSINVIEGYDHVYAPEDMPYWSEDSSAFGYWVERATAEKRLLAADMPPHFQTISLRLPLIIGERESAFVPGLLKTMRGDGTYTQVGNDRGLMDIVSGNDAARAHVLALRVLRASNTDVHGEAFNIIGKYPLSFWKMARIVWNEAGWEQKRTPYVVPEWLSWSIAGMSDILLRYLGIETQLSLHVWRFMCNSWTYDGSKARDRLGYVPEDDTEEQLRKSVRWHLAQTSD
jgi:sterol-4alpha-carboxylate 3-dehydrogenase (decarboxylating)